MEEIPFVDAHVHFWNLDRLKYAWLTPPFSDDGPNGSTEAIAHTYLPDAYREELAPWSPVGAVHIDAGADPAQALEETAWLEQLAEEGGLPSAIVAFAALDGDDVEQVLEQQAAYPRVRGIRHIANWHLDPRRTYNRNDPLVNPAWRQGYARLARHGLSFDLQCYPGQLAAAAELAAAHPGIPLILNHCGMPLLHEPGGLAYWRAGMRALAALPHAAVKLSGFGLVDRGWTVDSIRPLILETIDLFGTNRCMVASDFPTDRLFGNIDRVMGAYHQILGGFSLDERRGLFGRNAARIYRIAA
ncbi:putative TIM-barrel fold metal-dependent hydrolase [Nitrospirillum amazonense]|uniref:Putative TIM-barrel fold metal-dependent hydrolase n=1 Tax=Nitrospirillum amazonense TaxID=28077 RepID=A0A560EH84_9PROT|nr:amidohydrolase family protein [Nitrospirillum amazonense]TWB08692.1 putative TIM-barrel fold metal-dependent hydrolase [Nitrospirillum amazonense]